ncbi:hypothetical protein PINS_up022370 [Pythium insidiosum]|nr:hypothetical protein PINS_up022370 [Pythium insidiosum]
MRVDGATINAAPPAPCADAGVTDAPEKYNDRSRALMGAQARRKRGGPAAPSSATAAGSTSSTCSSRSRKATFRPRQSKSRASCARGDVQVLRRYSEFGNLRHEMYYHANSGHGINPCGFCAHLVDFISHGHSQPRVLTKLFRRGDDLCRLLDEYLKRATGDGEVDEDVWQSGL